MKNDVIILLTVFVLAQTANAQFRISPERATTVCCDTSESPVVHTALQLFARDYNAVFSDSIHQVAAEADIVIGTVDVSPLLSEFETEMKAIAMKSQAFLLKVLPKGRLLIAGSDPHGTAYGIMALSRFIGVSPWEWWADVAPEKKTSFCLPAGYQTMQSPAVEYRGIFVNDEDWGLMPWSSQTYEPSDGKGHIGPLTHARIFELLLRLRANTYWPPMHECSLPFFLTEGNREMAEKFGIYIGSSHCEPMACNAAGEWSRRGQGDYDYVNNSAAVHRFWEDRVKEVAGQEIMYTLGMRGIHDGPMQGAKTTEEQKAVLERVLEDQRQMLRENVDKDIKVVPQVLIPYKEVLDVYNAGLRVPDDVTLMWCDDNYGYIRHFPDDEERKREGGNGIYYHVSYWGRPHDYLWLGTFSPALLYHQMKLAYDKGIRKVWILNVGDIKPAEYQTELFMDMAWDMDGVTELGAYRHLGNFLRREFGEWAAEQLLPVMTEHYRLAYIRKPEFMGNTREEEWTPDCKVIKDMPWSERQIRERLAAYDRLSATVEEVEKAIPADRRSAYFELVKYPVQAAAQMNRKLLSAQLARHGKADWERSDAAFDSIAALTWQYNSLENGKWNLMMDCQPHRLPVFKRVERREDTGSLTADRTPVRKWNGVECAHGNPQPCEGLGYEGKAAGIGKGEALTFDFGLWEKNSVEVKVCLLPNHPVEGGLLRFSLSLDGGPARVVSYATRGRDEEWKENVLRNQAIRWLKLPIGGETPHRLEIRALDEGVVLDQVVLY